VTGGTGNPGGTGNVTWSDSWNGGPIAGTPAATTGSRGYATSDTYWDSRYAWEGPELCDRRIGPEQCNFLTK